MNVLQRHSGIDARAFVRALVKRGVMMQKNAGGGSTITQQLAKQFYSPTADNVMERLLQKPIGMGNSCSVGTLLYKGRDSDGVS